MINIKIASEEDIPTIRKMAEITFTHTYKLILSKEQIEYMMEWMYSYNSLCKQFNDEHVFFIAFKEEDTTPCGYLSLQKEKSKENNTDLYHLHKLYVMPEVQGCGVGEMLFRKAFNFVNENKKQKYARIELNVNRMNKAIGFYHKMGMKIISEGDFPIGNGYYMNDYIMSSDKF